MQNAPTLVGTSKSNGGYCVVIVNIASHIILDDLSIVRAKKNGILIEKEENDIKIKPLDKMWDEEKACQKRNKVVDLLITNRLHRLCDLYHDINK